MIKNGYGCFSRYIARKSGIQYDLIYLEKERVVFFGGDLRLVCALAMQTRNLLEAVGAGRMVLENE